MCYGLVLHGQTHLASIFLKLGLYPDRKQVPISKFGGELKRVMQGCTRPIKLSVSHEVSSTGIISVYRYTLAFYFVYVHNTKSYATEFSVVIQHVTQYAISCVWWG